MTLLNEPFFVVPIAIVVMASVLRLLRRKPWRGAKTRYPIVLAHGVMGYGELGFGKNRLSYFRGVGEHLKSRGVVVYQPQVPRTATVAERARALADYVEALEEPTVNIVAHSMGGLDARYAISKLNLAPRVASLTTIGTPHHGTPLADISAELFGGKFGLRGLLTGVGLGAFYDLTTSKQIAFNRDVPNVNGIWYGCVIGDVDPQKATLHPLLGPAAKFLRERVGRNDGLVPCKSQRWGRVLARIHADHWGEIGWSGGFDAPHFYERIAKKLRARGL